MARRPLCLNCGCLVEFHEEDLDGTMVCNECGLSGPDGMRCVNSLQSNAEVERRG